MGKRSLISTVKATVHMAVIVGLFNSSRSTHGVILICLINTNASVLDRAAKNSTLDLGRKVELDVSNTLWRWHKIKGLKFYKALAVEPPVSDHPKCQYYVGRLREIRQFWIKIFPHCKCRDWTHAQIPLQCFTRVKVDLEGKKSGSSHWEISVSCISQEYDNVTPYYPFFAPLSVKWSLSRG